MTKFILVQIFLILSVISVNYDFSFLIEGKSFFITTTQDHASISGTLYDSFGKSLDQVEVELTKGKQKFTTQSDTNGKYTFQGLESGDFIIETSASSKMMALNMYSRKNIHLDRNEIKVINLCPLIWVNDIPRKTGNISGKVVLATHDPAIPTVNTPSRELKIFIQIINPYSLDLIDEAIVSETGTYKLRVPCLGNYLMQVISQDCELEICSVKIDQTAIEKNFLIRKVKE